MLLDALQSDLITSLKAGKSDRVETIRFLISAVRNAAIAKYGNAWETSINDADVLDIVKKQIKTHRESIDAFGKAGRQELVDKENVQLIILEEFAPKELSDEELKKLLEPVVAGVEKDPSAASGQSFGLLMKSAMAAVHGQAEGGRVSALLRQLLQKA